MSMLCEKRFLQLDPGAGGRPAASGRLRSERLPGDADWRISPRRSRSWASRWSASCFSRYRVLLMHLLKWRYQQERRTRSWARTIENQRDDIAMLLEKNPSLRSKRAAIRRGLPARTQGCWPRDRAAADRVPGPSAHSRSSRSRTRASGQIRSRGRADAGGGRHLPGLELRSRPRGGDGGSVRAAGAPRVAPGDRAAGTRPDRCAGRFLLWRLSALRRHCGAVTGIAGSGAPRRARRVTFWASVTVFRS